MKPSQAPPSCPGGLTDRRGRPLGHADCCGRFIDGFDTSPAPDAEALMRSRYSAFALRRADYLLATWHPATRPHELDFDADARWLGLEVRAHRRLGDDHAEVDFIARYRIAGHAVRLAECSRFVREGGRWFYLDADTRA